MSTSRDGAPRFVSSRHRAGAIVLGGALGLLACETPPGADRDAPEDETLGQVQQALVCREGALDASKTFPFLLAPPTYADANVTFSPALSFKLPTQIPVTQGNSGHGRVVLTFGTSSGAVTCNYEGAHTLPFHVESELPAVPGNKYVFLSCSNGAVPGAAVTATSVNMHVKSSSFLAGTTKVRLSYTEPQPCGGGFDCGSAVIDDGTSARPTRATRPAASRTPPSRAGARARIPRCATARRRATARALASRVRRRSWTTEIRAPRTCARRPEA